MLIFSTHFSPAFKGGGPIQSLLNMVRVLQGDFESAVFCSAMDLGESAPLPGVKIDEWSGQSGGVSVFYSSGSNVISSIQRAFKLVKPDVVYINGMFSIWFNIAPLILAKWSRRRIVISPRGMLQSGALAIRPMKKKLFLNLVKLFHLYDQVRWHATDRQEYEDIKLVIGANSDVCIANNIPTAPALNIRTSEKAPGQLRLIYLSLITEKKGLHLVLQALSLIDKPIEFHIYGPVKDVAYWKDCQGLINHASKVHSIQYFGPVQPIEVPLKLASYHVMILPSRGENFGHAIYESLNAGTPVLLSKHTPWGNLQDHDAGVTVEELDKKAWADAIRKFIACDQQTYNRLSIGAHQLAADYFSKHDFVSQYHSIFESSITNQTIEQ